MKKQAITARADLSSADAARHSEAMSDFERRLQATEDRVTRVTLSIKGVDDSVRKELEEILKK